jgi:methyl-galactoside transport system substrate-binding protein
MLQGEATNPEAIARTEYSVKTVEEAGIKTEKLEFQICDWDQDKAQQAVEAWWSKHKDGIEVIIANNDGMAQGAIAALNGQGYNTGDAEKFVPVYGVDATAAAQDLINKEQMSGTVLQDAVGMAAALYTTGMNLAEGKDAIEGTEYAFDETGFSVRIPYQEYKK